MKYVLMYDIKPDRPIIVMFEDDVVIKDSYYGLQRGEAYVGSPYKVADTIFKLCDAFVYETDKRKIYTDRPDQNVYIEEGEKFIAYYGCVWIKGPAGEPILRPVAVLREGDEELKPLVPSDNPVEEFQKDL